MMVKVKKGLLIIIALVITGVLFQFSVETYSADVHDSIFKPALPPFINNSSVWVDSVFQTLSLEERIGQLFMVASHPSKGKDDVDRITELIKNCHVGGIIFFRGTPNQIAGLTKYYQSISRIPLLFAIDGEWGLSMRLDSTIKYPRQMMLGAITGDDIIYDMGRDIGKQLKMLGIHINFAPVIDVNNNPDNPVINSRSFGEMRDNVTRKGILYMRGIQDEGIIAVAKHFPGHGDTDVDSHLDLPIIRYSAERLDSIELYPFRTLIESGVSGIMMAHMNVLSLDSTPNLPSSLSKLLVDSLLKQKMKFKGLVFTDAMNMKSVSGLYKPEDANCLAVRAGNDIVLMPGDVEKSITCIERLLLQDSIEIEKIDKSCEKILQAKEWAVLPGLVKKPLTSKDLIDSLNSAYFELGRRKLIEDAITLVDNKRGLIPFCRIDTCKFAALSLGGEMINEYQQTLAKYSRVDMFHLSGNEDSLSIKAVLDTLKYYNVVLLSIHSDDMRSRKHFGVSDTLLFLADSILNNYPVVLNAFSSPYLLRNVKNLEKNIALIVSYDNDSTTQSLSAQMLFGAVGASGLLSVSINENYKVGTGMITQGGIRLKYTIPLEAGFSEKKLHVVDSIVNDAITKKAMPGCQIFVACRGKVIWERSYGFHTYSKDQKVENSNIYDLASITKIGATVPSLMLLEQNNQIDIHQKLVKYLPELDSTNKANLRISDILLHQAGLKSWIPFYISTLEPIYTNQLVYSSHYTPEYPLQLAKNYYVNKYLKYKDDFYSNAQSGVYSIEVAEGLFMKHTLIDTIYKAINESEVDPPGKYRYSDLGFYLFRKIIERESGQEFERFVDSCFYTPLGSYTLGFNPLKKFNKNIIVPTEDDLIFRKQIIHGYVHDPGAAMLGGVSGHAGLFANANDLAKFMQMILNKGTYGGQRYLSEKEIKLFTNCYACENGNRRGLGFDKPQKDTEETGPAMKGISSESYGHTGFTGTMVWADPSTGILYIFLSNRVYPDGNNNKLIDMNVRTNVQKAIYDALIIQQ
jgi:beta-glucosidase-like glycosyl hydrolase/CubicO group peptidase (beta-lactamase class C family)